MVLKTKRFRKGYCSSRPYPGSTVTTAQSMEAADRNAKSFKTTDSIAIQKVSTMFHQSHPPGGASGDTRCGSCRHCGRSNHSSGDCHYKDAECHNCGKRGHIAPICHSKPESKHKPDGSKRNSLKKIQKSSLGSRTSRF